MSRVAAMAQTRKNSSQTLMLQQQRQARIDHRQRAQVRLEADAGEEQAEDDGGGDADQQAEHPRREERALDVEERIVARHQQQPRRGLAAAPRSYMHGAAPRWVGGDASRRTWRL